MTLTQIAFLTKRAFLAFSGIIVLSIIVFLGYQYYLNYIYVPPKPPEPKPNLKFGSLPPLNLKQLDSSASSGYVYRLDNETGSLPKDFPKLIKVYYIPQLVVSLLAPDRARDLAKSFNFNNGPEILSPTKYKFTDDLGGGFIMDLNSGNFEYQHNVASDSASAAQVMEDPTQLSKNFKDFLSGKGLLKEQLSNGRSAVTYDSGDQRTSLSAEVSIWQDKVDDLEIITEDYSQGLVKALVIKANDPLKKYVKLNYTYWPIDLENSATYPLKTITQAYQELEDGKGYIFKQPQRSPVSISTINLAYLLSKDYQPYLQPVYVFRGADFGALIPAIPDENYSK